MKIQINISKNYKEISKNIPCPRESLTKEMQSKANRMFMFEIVSKTNEKLRFQLSIYVR